MAAERRSMDMYGATALVLFSLFLAFNQIVIKIGNQGFQPVFFAGLRSLGGIFVLMAWMRWRGMEIAYVPGTLRAGLAMGMIFTVEFIFLFLALDLTTVTRVSVIFYSMPVWTAVLAHFLLPGDRLTPAKAAGLILAFAGVAWAMLDRGGNADGASLIGDLFSLAGAIFWAGIAIMARGSAMVRVRPEMQLLYQLIVSGIVLTAVSPFFGPLLREVTLASWGALGFQILLVVSAGFLFWLWLLTIYPASSVASFSFLTPVFGVLLGWLLLDEALSVGIVGGLVLVALGLIVANRPARRGS